MTVVRFRHGLPEQVVPRINHLVASILPSREWRKLEKNHPRLSMCGISQGYASGAT